MATFAHKLGWLLLILAAVTRLAGLGYVDQVVFDEVHFGKFVTSYCCTGTRIFDIHPPHAKLIIAGVARLAGYRGGFDFDHIGEPYGTEPIVALRLAAALAGMMLPLIVFWLLKQAGVSDIIAFVGGWFMLFDNAFVLQSRLIALDSILLAATFGSLAVYWLADARPKMVGRAWLFLAAGGLAGLALGSKFTGLTALVLLGMQVILGLWHNRSQQALAWIGRGVVILVGAAIVYGGGWVIHYAILPNPGAGDAWQVPSGHLIADTIAMHKTMFDANYNLTATHPYSSFWWTWPIMARPVFYWQGEAARLYLIGNPAVWWITGLLCLTAIVDVVRRAVSRQRQDSMANARGWWFLVGYVVAYGPFMRIPRALFLYHYFMPLMFSLLFGLWWVHRELVRARVEAKRVRRWAFITMGVVVVVFVVFSPLTYGFPVSSGWLDWLVWFPTWR